MSATPVLRVTGGTTTTGTTLDRSEQVTSSATTVTDYQLAVTRTGDQSEAISYTSSAPSVATVSTGGLVSRVSAGKTTIEVQHGPVQVNVPLWLTTATDSSEVRTYTSGVAGSARAATESELDDALDATDPATDIRLYSAQDHATPAYTRNASNWATAAGIDLTSVSPWNSTGGNKRAGVAITPRHIVFAKHYQIGTGATVRFITADNTVVERTLTAKESLADTDLTIGLLDSDLPATITPCKVLPADWEDYFPTGLEHLPALCLDQEEKALVTDCGYTNGNLVMRVPTDATRLSYYEPKITGDSGNPAFLLLGGEAVLLTTWWFGGAGSGPFLPSYRTEIEAAITSLGANGHSLSDADLSTYTDFS
ncbi:MAG: Ig-like domain-containing protein [Verrucomicrobiales bacterium]